MVSGLMPSKKQKKNKQASQPATKSSKSTKKCKCPLAKTRSKLTIAEILKLNINDCPSRDGSACGSASAHHCTSNGNQKCDSAGHTDHQTDNHNNTTNSSNSNTNSSNSNTNSSNSNTNSSNSNTNSNNSNTNTSNTNTNNNNNKANTNNNNTSSSTTKNGNTKAGATSTNQSAKAKSGSGKRTEKQDSAQNSTGKKAKSARKRSPVWLKFSDTSISIAENPTIVAAPEPTSAWRPGTLYSDVLFSAGASSVVKIKTLTPSRKEEETHPKQSSAVKKRATKAQKSAEAAAENVAAATDRRIINRKILPDPNESNKTETPPAPSIEAADNEEGAACPSLSASAGEQPVISIVDSKIDDAAVEGAKSEAAASPVPNAARNPRRNRRRGNSSGSCLESRFKRASRTVSRHRRLRKPPVDVHIPPWNYTIVDARIGTFPKVLYQFEDENYLRAEKLALLGLKLALGNNTQQGRFKF